MILAFLLGIPFAWWIAILAILFLVDVACFAFESYGWSIFIMTATIGGLIYLDHISAASWIASNLHNLILFYIPGYVLVGLATAFIKWILHVRKRVGWIKDVREQFEAKKYVEDKPDFEKAAKKEIDEKLQAEREQKSRRGEYDDYRTARTEDEKKAAAEAAAAAEADRKSKIAARAAALESDWEAGTPARRREAFVDFYKRSVSSYKHKIYEVDHGKVTSIVDALTPRAKDNVGKITIWIYQWPVVIVASLIEDLIIKLAKHFARFIDAVFSGVVRKMVAKATQGL